MDILEGLNEQQRVAAMVTSGPLLILAGAGSGKTKTLTHRIAYLLTHEGVYPSQILAVTFTNKAAREMRERLAKLLGQTAERGFMTWMGTFHSICVRLLRIDGEAIGIAKNFVIYDEDDRQSLVKQAMRQLSISDKELKVRAVVGAISSAKNDLVDPTEFAAAASFPYQKNIAKIYALYEELKRTAGALDFDDLLLEAVRLLKDAPDVRSKWRTQFKHILIDEYQDTNAAQYQLVKLLVGDERNIAVVGDDWQSIYSWRGADFTNILNFERDFKGATVVKLEQNYRSTGNILEAAHNVITKNVQRTDKKLWTAEDAGAPVQVHGQYDETDEARFVAERIQAQVTLGARHYHDFAVLYRTNAQSQPLERVFLQAHVPYQIVGGVRFYDRRVVKDIVAYLKLLYQPNDRVSFSRIANVPTRGVGAVSLEKFFGYQSASGQTILEALADYRLAEVVSGKARQALSSLGSLLGDLARQLDTLPPDELINTLISSIHYRDYLNDGTPQAADNNENLDALMVDAKAFTTLADFLEEVALVASSDAATDDDTVTLMTLHAAKGLEFPAVFMVGMEEGILPHARVYEGGQADLEEERRLAYVGMTRAREELHLSYAMSRLQYQGRSYNQPSRFLADMGSNVAVAEASQTAVDDEPFYSDEFLQEGDRVRSGAFGVGEVVEVDGLAVVVRFDSGQTRKLNAEFAHLQKV